jgi:hemerythrin-like domain-containing protein
MNGLCESLVREHEVIELVLAVIETEADKVRAGATVNKDFFVRAVSFVREYADGIHHRKEEDALFPGLCAAGIPNEGGPVGVMLADHEAGRAHIRAMVESLDAAAGGDATARDRLVEESLGYVNLLRAHIMKENMVLFPMADQVLSSSQKMEITRAFQEAEAAAHEVTNRQRAWAQSLRP